MLCPAPARANFTFLTRMNQSFELLSVKEEVEEVDGKADRKKMREIVRATHRHNKLVEIAAATSRDFQDQPTGSQTGGDVTQCYQ